MTPAPTDSTTPAGGLTKANAGGSTASRVVQVGVADPTGLDGDHCLARSGVRNDDVDELDRLPLLPRDDSLHDLRHASDPSSCDLEGA